jgi:hypothetical protein
MDTLDDKAIKAELERLYGPEIKTVPPRRFEESYIYVRRWFGWTKVPTTNTAIKRLMERG